MSALASILLGAGAYVFAWTARLYVPRLARINFLILFVLAFILEVVLFVLVAIAAHS